MLNDQSSSNPSESQEKLKNFWSKTMEDIKEMKPNEFKTQELPLARIKKIMKMDEDVKMISGEAPVLFAKAAEIFIHELTLRGWVYAEENKRRTLQRNDIAVAITKYDQFDFLIDIVPREELRPAKKEEGTEGAVKYLVQVDQNNQAIQLPNTSQHFQLMQGGNGMVLTQPVLDQAQQNSQLVQNPTVITTQMVQQQQIQQQLLQQQQLQQQQIQQTTTPQTMQVFTQVTGPNGEVQQIPIQLTQAQLQQIVMQMQGKPPGQPIVIQTSNTGDQLNSTVTSNGCDQFTSQVSI